MPEDDFEKRQGEDEQFQRQILLLQAIIRIFRETPDCEDETEVARLGLKIAEELSGSAISFLGELNPEGRFDTTTLSARGWKACRVPRPEAE
jgi:hypothetical protein